MVNPFDAVMRALALSTAVAVVYKGFLEYGRDVAVNQMMNHSITKIGGKYLTLYWFLYHKTDASYRFVASCNNAFV